MLIGEYCQGVREMGRLFRPLHENDFAAFLAGLLPDYRGGPLVAAAFGRPLARPAHDDDDDVRGKAQGVGQPVAASRSDATLPLDDRPPLSSNIRHCSRSFPAFPGSRPIR